MGYTTYFTGEFNITPNLSPIHTKYLEAFSGTRRMKRDSQLLRHSKDPDREAAGLPLGDDGEFYVGSQNDFGQNRTEDILDYNSPPSTQPSLWCSWVPNDDGSALIWNEMEKFYEYDLWLQYLLDKFLIPWGYTVNGEVHWNGEENEDMGILEIVNNTLIVKRAIITYG